MLLTRVEAKGESHDEGEGRRRGQAGKGVPGRREVGGRKSSSKIVSPGVLFEGGPERHASMSSPSTRLEGEEKSSPGDWRRQ
jgi:hypothetical protein